MRFRDFPCTTSETDVHRVLGLWRERDLAPRPLALGASRAEATGVSAAKGRTFCLRHGWLAALLPLFCAVAQAASIELRNGAWL